MKVGILTFHCTDNPGSILQAYALQQSTEALGVDPYIINYQRKGWHERLNQDYKKIVKKRLHLFWTLGYGLIKCAESTVYRRYDCFRSNFLKIEPSDPISDREIMLDLGSLYDKWIVGSDQVWNLVNPKVDYTQFLDFVAEDRKKIAYAPSFGSEDILPAHRDKVTELLRHIPYISVRETQGAELVEKLTGRCVPVVLDPTLLLDESQWREIAVLPKEKDYILLYLRERSMLALDIAKELSKRTESQIVLISPMLMRMPLVGKRVICPAPQRWLGWFLNAKYVVTNSFHGLAFSINFNKQFYAVPLNPDRAEHDTNPRINSALAQFGIENRMVGTATSVLDVADIDFERLNARLNMKRIESTNYLKSAIYGEQLDDA